MGSLRPFHSIEKDVTSFNTATFLQIKYQKRDSALLAHAFNYRGSSACSLEPDHISREKRLNPPIDDRDPNDLIPVFQCGGTPGAGAFVTQVMQ